ncbi:MAG: DUF2975 domain-containing protein [Brevundimonas subvibrioides]|uniref:DUF2975 domain-containing protein n=1 Tax=Brevundimonas subvibrioides TaxID=74313 RepID=A0A258HIH6_9CAUL|nr:DUF2975 domain-containing protein [Brevundimonas subvibrioides]OYX56716.1 MAG: DUF2975 domain-containing protein [Brevundimonas subvibrioides]
MTTQDLTRFRRMCGQFRWLAVFMVCSVGAILALIHLVAPTVLTARGDTRIDPAIWLEQAVWATPTLFYLFAVWAIGSAMGQLARGRLIQPILGRALRHVGIALGLGGLLSVFGVTNISRLLGGHGSFAYFDVAGMTLGMIGGALFLLGRVVDQADRIQSELDEMI